MEIRYLKKQLKINLIFGIIWTVVGIIAIVSNMNNISFYGFLSVGIIHLWVYFLYSKYPYLIVGNGTLTKNIIFRKSINFSELKKMERFVGEWALYTRKKKLTIPSDLMDNNSFEKLDSILLDLNSKNKVPLKDWT